MKNCIYLSRLPGRPKNKINFAGRTELDFEGEKLLTYVVAGDAGESNFWRIFIKLSWGRRRFIF